MCRFRVKGRPIHRMFNRFQNVPTSCERNLKLDSHIPAQSKRFYMLTTDAAELGAYEGEMSLIEVLCFGMEAI